METTQALFSRSSGWTRWLMANCWVLPAEERLVIDWLPPIKWSTIFETLSPINLTVWRFNLFTLWLHTIKWLVIHPLKTWNIEDSLLNLKMWQHRLLCFYFGILWGSETILYNEIFSVAQITKLLAKPVMPWSWSQILLTPVMVSDHVYTCHGLRSCLHLSWSQIMLTPVMVSDHVYTCHSLTYLGLNSSKNH